MKMNTDLTIAGAFGRFITEKKATGLSDETVRSYQTTFDVFTRSCPKDTPCTEIDISTIYEFIDFLRKRNSNIKNISINTYLRNVDKQAVWDGTEYVWNTI